MMTAIRKNLADFVAILGVVVLGLGIALCRISKAPALAPLRLLATVFVVCGVFIHPAAEDNAKILKFNYEATKLSIERAMKSLPTPQEIVAAKETAKHPFA